MATAMESTNVRPITKKTPRPRAFRVNDIMILVAATAAGCGLMQGISAVSDGQFTWSYLYDEAVDLLRGAERGPYALGTVDFCFLLIVLSSPFVAMWTLALIPIRLLGPRPRVRRLARQPGLMAVCGAGVAISAMGMQFAVGALVVGTDSFATLYDVGRMLAFSPIVIGLAVLVSWMTLLVGRRWRAEASWIDRLGRAAGVFWILAGIAMTSLFVLDHRDQWCGFQAPLIPQGQPAAVETLILQGQPAAVETRSDAASP